MKRKNLIRWLTILLVIFLSACTPQAETQVSTSANLATEAVEEVNTEAPSEADPAETEEVIPTPTSRTVIWEDDFSDVNSGWERYRAFDGVLDYGETQEVYQMQVNVENNLFWVMKDDDLVDVTMSVEAWQVGGPEGSLYGLMCRYDPNVLDGYFFLISSQGEAGVGTFGPGFQPISGGELTEFDAIQTGINVRNTIAISCTGDSLIMAVNGEELFNLPATGLSGGDIGMAVATPMGAGADVYFDNLTVYQP